MSSLVKPSQAFLASEVAETKSCKGITIFWGYTNVLPWNFTCAETESHESSTSRTRSSKCSHFCCLVRIPSGILVCAFFKCFTRILHTVKFCKHLSRASKQLLSTQADDMSYRSLCTAQRSNRAGFDCCYTLIFGTELYFSLSCFPKTLKTFLIKVIPQSYFSVRATFACGSNLLLAGKIAFEPLIYFNGLFVLMVQCDLASQMGLRKSYLGNVSLFKSKRKYSCKCVGNFSYNE